MYEIETREVDEQQVAVMRGKVHRDELGSWLAAAYGTLTAHLQTIAVQIVGVPFARYADRTSEILEVEAGLPVAETVTSRDQVEVGNLPGGSVAATWHDGPYTNIGPAYEAVEQWLARTGVEAIGRPWEHYHPDPERESEAESWITEVVQPFREA